jgi:hypothetical protein
MSTIITLALIVILILSLRSITNFLVKAGITMIISKIFKTSFKLVLIISILFLTYLYFC